MTWRNDDDADSDAELDEGWEPACLQTCRPKFMRVHDKAQWRKAKLGQWRQKILYLVQRDGEQKTKIRQQKGMIEELEKKNDVLMNGLGRTEIVCDGLSAPNLKNKG